MNIYYQGAYHTYMWSENSDYVPKVSLSSKGLGYNPTKNTLNHNIFLKNYKGSYFNCIYIYIDVGQGKGRVKQGVEAGLSPQRISRKHTQKPQI